MPFPVASTPFLGSTPAAAYSGTFIPEVWSGKLVEKFYKATVLGAIANTDYEGEIKNQLGAGKQTLVVAAMAAYVPVLANGPAVPGCLHDMARMAEIGILLHIVIEMDKLVATKGDDNQDDDRNRYSYLLRLFTHPAPEAPYSGSEPMHLLPPSSISPSLQAL